MHARLVAQRAFFYVISLNAIETPDRFEVSKLLAGLVERGIRLGVALDRVMHRRHPCASAPPRRPPAASSKSDSTPRLTADALPADRRAGMPARLCRRPSAPAPSRR